MLQGSADVDSKTMEEIEALVLLDEKNATGQKNAFIKTKRSRG